MNTPEKDFAPLPQYTQSTVKNESWVVVTITRTDGDGSVTQTSAIVSKRS